MSSSAIGNVSGLTALGPAKRKKLAGFSDQNTSSMYSGETGVKAVLLSALLSAHTIMLSTIEEYCMVPNPLEYSHASKSTIVLRKMYRLTCPCRSFMDFF